LFFFVAVCARPPPPSYSSFFIRRFEAGFGEASPPPSSDDDVAATGMVRGALAFGLDNSDSDDAADGESDSDDERQQMPRMLPSRDSSRSSHGHGDRRFPLKSQGRAAMAMPAAGDGGDGDYGPEDDEAEARAAAWAAGRTHPPFLGAAQGYPKEGYLEEATDLSQPLTFDDAFPSGIFPAGPSDLAAFSGGTFAGGAAGSAESTKAVRFNSGSFGSRTARPPSNTEVVELDESDSDSSM
jgi:hypothetical protein